MNVADSEVVAAIMEMAGYTISDKIDDADAVLLNTCSIRDNAEQKIVSRLQALGAERRKRGRLIIGVIGCMAERVQQELVGNHGVDIVAGPDSYMDLPALFASAEQGHPAVSVELSTTETYRDIVPARIPGHNVSGFISIMRGCDNFCSYCIVPYTRGRERSRPLDSILRELSDLRARGYKEVTLLGQNVNSYRFVADDGTTTDFAALLSAVATAAPDMRVRVHHIAPKGHVRHHNRRHSGAPKHLPPYTPPCTERQQLGAQSHEPQVHARMVPRPHSRNTQPHSRLRHKHRPVHRFSRRKRRGFRANPRTYARSRLRLLLYVQILGTPRYTRRTHYARQHQRRCENRAP